MTKLSTAAKILSMPFFALALSLVGCSSAEDGSQAPSSPAEAPKVQMPAIEGDVAQAEFCDLFKLVHCAANVGCCGRPDLQSRSVDECLATTACLRAMDEPAVKSGHIRYDEKAAGEFLRGMAKVGSSCGAPAEKAELPFLMGTREEGDDCSPVGGDKSLLGVCAPGLSCAMSTDKSGEIRGVCARGGAAPALAADGQACEGGGQCASGRCAQSQCAPRLPEGASCLASSDCESGLCGDGSDEPDCASGKCACAPSGDRYCKQPMPAPPSNADWKNPDRLCVLAHTSSNSGTGGNIEMGWEYHSERWGCTIYGGVKTGNKACCTPTYVASTFSSTREWLYVQSKSTDGLLIDKVYVEDGTESWGEGTWDHSQPKGDCDGCVFGQNCNQCWLDADDHEKCTTWLFDMEDNTATCADSIGFYP